jgi:hypothetical protein
MGIIWAARSGCSLPAPTLDANMAAAHDSLATFSWLELSEESAARGGRAGGKRTRMSREERGMERRGEERRGEDCEACFQKAHFHEIMS